MKSEKNGLLTIVLTTFLGIALVGCSLSRSESSKGDLVLYLKGSVSRTILPDVNMVPVSYRVYGSGPNGVSFEQTIKGNYLIQKKIQTGLWSIYVEALNIDGIIIGEGNKSVIIESDRSSNITITVGPISGSGTLNLELNWKEEAILNPVISASLEPLVNGSKIDIDFNISGSVAKYRNTVVPTGYYILSIKLLDDTTLTMGAVEAVRIVSGQVTTGHITLEKINEKQWPCLQMSISDQMNNPLDVDVIGASTTKTVTDNVVLNAIVNDYNGNVIYSWFVNGECFDNSTEHNFIFDNTWDIGYYRIDVIAKEVKGCALGSKTVYIDVVETHELEKTDMVYVGGGKYTQLNENGEYISENTLSDFAIGKYEVTYELWYSVYKWAVNNGYNFANPGREGSQGIDGADPTFALYEPVCYINWRDVIIWCNAYSEKSGYRPVYKNTDGFIIKDSRDENGIECDSAIPDESSDGYKIPTEIQWQYAASNKGNTPSNYASGAENFYEDRVATNKVAWWSYNTDKTKIVGLRKANKLGIYDMSGNVAEWCYDRYPDNDMSIDEMRTFRIYRGGDFLTHFRFVQVGFRLGAWSSSTREIGFRLLRSK